MTLITNRHSEMQFVKISFFINENEIHGFLEPFHQEKCHIFLFLVSNSWRWWDFFRFFILSDVITVFSLRQINLFWKRILMFLLENNKWQDRNGIHWKWRIGENDERNAHKHYKRWSVIFVRIYDAEKKNAEVMHVPRSNNTACKRPYSAKIRSFSAWKRLAYTAHRITAQLRYNTAPYTMPVFGAM